MAIFSSQFGQPPLWLMLPFAALLGAIAVAPLILQHHWERHYHRICFTLAALVIAYYAFVRGDNQRVFQAAADYFSFIVVVAGFYIIAGGIHLRSRHSATPLTNTVFLIGGTVLAGLIGTIAASLVLIRPWIEMNRNRFAGFHLAFFIFLVSNAGGALLPVGPPLLLGYQKGIPFLWPLLRCWRPSLLAIACLLGIFFIVDLVQFRSRNYRSGKRGKWRIFGVRNCVSLGGVLLSLIFLPPVWRELVIIAVTAASFYLTPAHVHRANGFTFAPIVEVTWLFLGIFGTMIPVLDYVQSHARDLGLDSATEFYWATGVLSGLLDNAPTYLTFLAGAVGLDRPGSPTAAHDVTTLLRHHELLVVAISVAATLFGALSYIGNGPNLLVRAIAQEARVATPSFFGFSFRYAVPCLLPVLIVVALLFF